MRTIQPLDPWTAYFAILTEPLSAAPIDRYTRRDGVARVDPVRGRDPQREPRRSLVERLDHWFWRQQQAACERELARSVDLYDLERRVRALDRTQRTLF